MQMQQHNSGKRYRMTAEMTNGPTASVLHLRSTISSPTYQPGLCGLQNMGNTCFMNSALQCLSNLTELTEYFLQGHYKDEINDRNPLGTQGRLAKEYAELLKKLWSGHQNILRPYKLKLVIGMFAPRFNGFAQQDSHELAAFLLDGLHEDLNRVRKKLTTEEKREESKQESESKDSALFIEPNEQHINSSEELNNGEEEKESGSKEDEGTEKEKETESSERNDCDKHQQNSSSKHEKSAEESTPQTAEDAWQEYKKCNDSIIADLLHGQLKSSLTCNVCHKVSVKFDPFCFLSLPIPPRSLGGSIMPIEEEPKIWRIEARRQRSNENVQEGQLASEVLNEHPTEEIGTELSVSQRSIYAKYLWWVLATAMDWLILPWTKRIVDLYRNTFTGPISLEHCLRSFFSVDYLHGDDMYKCEGCKRLRNGTKHCTFTLLPEVLCIHLKRFRNEGMYNVKVNSKISFPLTDLDLRPFMHSEALYDQNGQPISTRYDICAMISHKGQNMEYGHYVSYCRIPEDSNFWYEFDDARVTRISSVEVSAQEAYVLFYKRNGTLGNEDELMAEDAEEEEDENEDEGMYTAEEDEWTNPKEEKMAVKWKRMDPNSERAEENSGWEQVGVNNGVLSDGDGNKDQDMLSEDES